jgi:hypothetical protein
LRSSKRRSEFSVTSLATTPPRLPTTLDRLPNVGNVRPCRPDRMTAIANTVDHNAKKLRPGCTRDPTDARRRRPPIQLSACMLVPGGSRSNPTRLPGRCATGSRVLAAGRRHLGTRWAPQSLTLSSKSGSGGAWRDVSADPVPSRLASKPRATVAQLPCAQALAPTWTSSAVVNHIHPFLVRSSVHALVRKGIGTAGLRLLCSVMFSVCWTSSSTCARGLSRRLVR